MKIHPFTADSALEAIDAVKRALGPEAVVLNVRPVPREGLARFWQKPRIEILACAPETEPEIPDPLTALRQEIAELKQELPRLHPSPTAAESTAFLDDPREDPHEEPRQTNAWRVVSFLEKGGLLPLHAHRIVERLQLLHGAIPPRSLVEEMNLARSVFHQIWNQPEPICPSRPQVLVGPPGSGKTTCLSKWLTQTVLLQGRKAQVWRLDGMTANTSETLSVYCEILNVPIQRNGSPGHAAARDSELEKPRPCLNFIDLPGINWADPSALEDLARHIRSWNAQVHLVVNGAYESTLLMAQARAFSVLPVDSLFVTHLDEELRWGKIWNLVVGNGLPLRYLSAGPCIPGQFEQATPDRLLDAQFPGKHTIAKPRAEDPPPPTPRPRLRESAAEPTPPPLTFAAHPAFVAPRTVIAPPAVIAQPTEIDPPTVVAPPAAVAPPTVATPPTVAAPRAVAPKQVVGMAQVTAMDPQPNASSGGHCVRHKFHSLLAERRAKYSDRPRSRGKEQFLNEQMVGK